MFLVEGESFPTTCRNAAVSCRVTHIQNMVKFHTKPSLRTVDAFPVFASLSPIFQRERSDDRKCVCCSQATQSPAGLQNSAGEAKPSLLPSVSVPANIFILYSLLIQYRMRCDCGYEKTRWGGGGDSLI